MFRTLRKNKAQTTLELAILIGVVVAGLVAMQVYVKRGLQGKIRESADNMGQQFTPGETKVHYTTSSTTNSSEVLAGEETTTTVKTQATNRIGTENLMKNLNEEQWLGAKRGAVN